MIYKHQYFQLNTQNKKVFDENNKELKITGNSFRVLVFLCEYGPATITNIGDALDRAKDYDEDHIRQYRYKINTIIGKNIIKYENKIYFIDGETQKIENENSQILDKNNRNTDLLQPDSVKSIVDNNTTMDQGGYCQKCGEKIQEGQRFCVFCGIPLENIKPQLIVINKNKEIHQNSRQKLFFVLILVSLLVVLLVGGYWILLTKEKSVENNSIISSNFREITNEEINKFIPINYSTIKSEYTGNTILAKINNIYILPVSAKGDMLAEGSAKIMILKYNSNLDKYEIINEYIGAGDYISDFDNSYDVNNDGLNEIFAVFQLNGVSGSSNTLEILNLKDNKFEKLLFADVLNINYFRYDDKKKELITSDDIWNLSNGESHFGCHYFNIETYLFDDNKFILKNKKQTKFKYDMGDDLGIDNIKCLSFKENFNDFLMSENVIY